MDEVIKESMTVTVTVIIPIYNSEPYLRQCIESVLGQTYGNIEVLLIDDGSTDCSLSICKEYTENDSRVKTIMKQNGGVSSARNLGISEAKGDWIAFVDSDDNIEPNYLQKLYEAVEKSNGKDFVIQGYDVIHAGDEKEEHHLQYAEFNLCYNTNFFEETDILEHGHVCGRLYNTKILKANNIRFNADINYAEDQIFMLQYLCYVDKVIYIEGSGYNYRMLGTGLSNKFGSFESNYSLFSQFMCAMRTLAATKKFDIPNYAKRIGAMHLFRAIIALYTNHTIRQERMNTLKQLRREHKYLISKYYVPRIFQMKIGKLLFLMNSYLFDGYFMLKFKKYRQ